MDKLIFKKQSKYALIELFEDIKDKHLTLSLNGYVQFEEGRNEKSYHNALVMPLKDRIDNINRVLILGGGDGLAARNLLTIKPELKITLVDIDKDVVDLCRNHPRIRKINKGSLDKINIVYADAKIWILGTKDKFDGVILDFPDATNKQLETLYTPEFYKNVAGVLRQDGIVSIQAGNNWIKTFDATLAIFSRVEPLKYNMYNSRGYIIHGRSSGFKNRPFQELLSASSK